MHYLYRITDTLNNKIYIGQSNKETERWRQHKYFARQNEPIQYVHRAMKKYGVENFIYEVVAMCRTQEDADEVEILLIKQYDSRNKEKGYNVAPGGDHAWNAGLPKELNPLTGVPRTEETRKRISEGNIGKIMPPCSEKRKEHMSKKYKGRTLPKDWVEKIAASNRGKIRSPETKMKLSISHTGKTGENASNVKLNWEIVKSIRKEYATGNISHRELGEKYGVNTNTIGDVIRNKSWKE